MKKLSILTIVVLLIITGSTSAQNGFFLIGDARPDAPELAPRGTFDVGVRTFRFVNEDVVDILNSPPFGQPVLYDRAITVEVWYPADVGRRSQISIYRDFFGQSNIPGSLEPFIFLGRARRNAPVAGENHPLVIVSHGYPGSRFQLTNLTENLASKGYVVAAIDHTESTFLDTQDVSSTLFNRATDQSFVIDELLKLVEDEAPFEDFIDPNRIASIGYSFGGTGTLNLVGAGYNPAVLGPLPFLAPVIGPRAEFSPTYVPDERIDAAVLFAPGGGSLFFLGQPQLSLFSASALANIDIPTLWVAGSQDDVVGYDAVLSLFNNTVNSERYFLTYREAQHNVAPNPPTSAADEFSQFERYTDAAWDRDKMININQHFLTAFLGYYLQGDASFAPFLDLAVEDANDGVFIADANGDPTPASTYWTGFLNRTATGMSWQERFLNGTGPTLPTPESFENP